MSYGHHYYPATSPPVEDEVEVERELSYGTLDRAISAVAHPGLAQSPQVHQYMPHEMRAHTLSPIRESGESSVYRPISILSSGHSMAPSSDETAVSPSSMAPKLVAKRGYKPVEEESDEDEEEEEEDEDISQVPSRYANVPNYAGSYGPALNVAWPRTQSAYDAHGRPFSGYAPTAAATSTYTAPSYRPPRSRSPTPEDYDIVEKHDIEAAPRRMPMNDGSSATLSVEETPELGTTQHFGPAPTGRIARRHLEKKRVKLWDGHLVVDLGIPRDLVLPYPAAGQEMRQTRLVRIGPCYLHRSYTTFQVHCRHMRPRCIHEETLFTPPGCGWTSNRTHGGHHDVQVRPSQVCQL